MSTDRRRIGARDGSWIFAIFWLVLISAVLFGVAPSLRADDQYASAPFSVAARPLAKLDPLVGSWTGVWLTPATQDQPPESSPFEARFWWILGRNHLQGNFRYQHRGEPLEARTLWGYTPSSQLYTVVWINDMSSVATFYQGAFGTDGSLVLTTKRKIEEQIVTERLRLDLRPDRGWTITSENDLPGEFVTMGTLTAY